tara:strand:- start:462 stop:716 length:255 start_codon:yes stop_codon:yes gene_type:complete
MSFLHYSFGKATPRRPHGAKSKTLYTCGADDKHRLTYKQAVSSGWVCTHCGNELKARQHKITELHQLATQLGYTARPQLPKDKT